MNSIAEKKQFVWTEMQKLELTGLGKCERFSDLRDKFVLNVEHPSASKLTDRPRANGFIRSDTKNLLVRYPSEDLRKQIKTQSGAVKDSARGIEFRWSTLHLDDISRLFDVVKSFSEILTPIQHAKEYVLNRVQRPALRSEIPEKTKNKIRNSNLWISKFSRVGDLLTYLQRFRPDDEDAIYKELKQHKLATFEDIVSGFEQKFSAWAHDRTRANDFVIGEKYDAYQILIFANTYDTRAGGMFVIETKEMPAYVVIKATLEGGAYANEWLESGFRLKYFLKSINGVFGEDYKANAAILNNLRIPILTFVRDSADEPFTYFGIFNYRDIVRQDGAKYFILERANIRQDTDMITSDYLQRSFQTSIDRSIKSGREKRLARLAKADKRPAVVRVVATSYERNPDVVAEVLHRAEGRCEMCNSLAPFKRRSDGSPYLEVHHKIQLAAGGDDTVENAIALCPNCHRKSHFGLPDEIELNS